MATSTTDIDDFASVDLTPTEALLESFKMALNYKEVSTVTCKLEKESSTSGESSHRARKATCLLWVLLVELKQIRSVPRHKSFLLPIVHEG